MPCRISPITRTLKYRSSAATEESQRIMSASAREPLHASETTLVSRTKLKAYSSISARQVYLSRKVIRWTFRDYEFQPFRRAHQEFLEVQLLPIHPPILLCRNYHYDLLAVPRDHLRSLLQCATYQLAEPLLRFLQLPGHGFFPPNFCLVCLDYKIVCWEDPGV